MIAPRKDEENEGRETHLPDPKEMRAVVERLQKLIVDYVVPAKSMQLKLKPQDILKVLDEAERKAKEPEAAADFGQSPEGYFLEGLYEELVQQPGSIFEKVADPEGREQFAPMRTEVWLACLGKLKEIIRKGAG